MHAKIRGCGEDLANSNTEIQLLVSSNSSGIHLSVAVKCMTYRDIFSRGTRKGEKRSL